MSGTDLITMESPRRSRNLAQYYLGALRQTSATTLESALVEPPDLSNAGITDRLQQTRWDLTHIVKTQLGDDPRLHQLVERILRPADRALRMLRDAHDELAQDPDALDALEAVVRTDGSRPSFMIRNGAVDVATSPVGSWEDTLQLSAESLAKTLPAVGRIEVPSAPQHFVGTGFLLQQNVIVTNRHVLQGIAARDEDGIWRIAPDAVIDFGREFRARSSVSPRRLKSVIFAGPDAISSAGPVVHRKLDLALIELERAAPLDTSGFLNFDVAPDWAYDGQMIYTIGYPGNPGLRAGAPTSLLEQLFKLTYGCKRLAPGLVIGAQDQVEPWTLAHDATTLGGNSGSVVMVIGREGAAAGLHYGGRASEPRENWGHVLGKTLGVQDPRTGRTLRECLVSLEVVLIDRVLSAF